MNTVDSQIKQQNHGNESFFFLTGGAETKMLQAKKARSRKVIRQNSQKYHWRHRENIKYLEFIISQRLLFDLDIEEKRYIGINKLMSAYIKTRDSVQCHSHHQKILKKYGDIDRAIVEMTQVYFKKSKKIRKAAQKHPEEQEVLAQRVKLINDAGQITGKRRENAEMLPAQRKVSQQVKIEETSDW